MGWNVSVYRAADREDCTAGGISSRSNTLCVVNIDGPHQPSERAPAVRLVRHHWCPDLAILVPDGTDGGMFGGNFASSSSGYWENALKALVGDRHGRPVAIHDRFEGERP